MEMWPGQRSVSLRMGSVRLSVVVWEMGHRSSEEVVLELPMRDPNSPHHLPSLGLGAVQKKVKGHLKSNGAGLR